MFVISVPTLSLDQTFRSGQYLRWHEVTKGEKYVIYSGRRVLKAEQKGDKFLLNCSEAEFFDYWYDYFDLGFDYVAERAKLCKESKSVAYASEINDCIHLIRQDPYDVLMTLVLKCGARMSANKAWDVVCHACGERKSQGMAELGTLTWFYPPEPEEILWNADWLDEEELGERTVEQLQAVADAMLEGSVNTATMLRYVVSDELKALRELFDMECLQGVDWREFALLCGCKRVWPGSHKVELTVRRHEGLSVQDYLEWNLSGLEDLHGLAYAYLRASGSKRLSALRRLKKDGKELPIWA